MQIKMREKEKKRKDKTTKYEFLDNWTVTHQYLVIMLFENNLKFKL